MITFRSGINSAAYRLNTYYHLNPTIPHNTTTTYYYDYYYAKFVLIICCSLQDYSLPIRDLIHSPEII
jgi:hypothetical protein